MRYPSIIMFTFVHIQMQGLTGCIIQKQMDETEKYLNSILQKRMGSVINQSAFSKNAHTVTRIPRQEEKVQSMPIVFRKQYETVLMQQSERQATARMTLKAQQAVKQEQNKPMGSHRVEYVAISKRLISKKQDDYISPTVDITTHAKPQLQKEQINFDQSAKQPPKVEQRVQQILNRQPESVDSGKPKRCKIFS